MPVIVSSLLASVVWRSLCSALVVLLGAFNNVSDMLMKILLVLVLVVRLSLLPPDLHARHCLLPPCFGGLAKLVTAQRNARPITQRLTCQTCQKLCLSSPLPKPRFDPHFLLGTVCRRSSLPRNCFQRQFLFASRTVSARQSLARRMRDHRLQFGSWDPLLQIGVPT
jgi:hypothetical protein